MTNEEFDRKIEFLLNQQAKLDSDMQRLEAAHTFTAEALTRLIETVGSLATVMFEGFKVLDNKIQALAESQKLMTETQKRTDESLRNLAELIERHIREGHHGPGPLGSET